MTSPFTIASMLQHIVELLTRNEERVKLSAKAHAEEIQVLLKINARLGDVERRLARLEQRLPVTTPVGDRREVTNDATAAANATAAADAGPVSPPAADPRDVRSITTP